MDEMELKVAYTLAQGKVLIVSDTHGHHNNLEKVLSSVKPDLMLHLGDSENYEEWIADRANCPVVFVRGNCDFGNALANEAIVELGNHRALLCHGHRHGVRYGLEELGRAAKAYGCDAAMFGHTHEPEVTEEDGVIIYNPGSLSQPRQFGNKPSFIVLDIDKKGEWHAALKYLRRR